MVSEFVTCQQVKIRQFIAEETMVLFLALKVTPAVKSCFLHHLLPPKQNWSQLVGRGPAHSSKITQRLACNDKEADQVPMNK